MKVLNWKVYILIDALRPIIPDDTGCIVMPLTGFDTMKCQVQYTSTNFYLGVEHAHFHFTVTPLGLGLAEPDEAGLGAQDEIVERFGAGHQIEGSR